MEFITGLYNYWKQGLWFITKWWSAVSSLWSNRFIGKFGIAFPPRSIHWLATASIHFDPLFVGKGGI